ncbi:MAG: hypothetical protein AB7F86_04165 [Bdellovibrionales bacterium]
MKNWVERFKKWSWETRLLVIMAVVVLLPAILNPLLSSSEKVPAKSISSMDTHIPRGFVLVPIEVQNFEALDSILGRFGVVDLFQTASDGHGPHKPIAKNVKLLRAPQNPTRFAVLVPESQAPSILAGSGLFYVVVKRPEEGGTEFVKKDKQKRSIVYGGDL